MTPSSLSDEHDSTEFFEVNSSESEDGVMKDVKKRLACPHLRTLSTERLTCPLPRNTEHVSLYKGCVFWLFANTDEEGGGLKSAGLRVFLVQSRSFLVTKFLYILNFVPDVWIQRHRPLACDQK